MGGIVSATAVKNYLRRRVLVWVVTFAVAWVGHTYLLIVVNEGFLKETWVSHWINVPGNMASAVPVWVVGSFLLWSYLFALPKVGPVRAATHLVGIPIGMFRRVKRSGRMGLSAWGLGGGLALLVGWIAPINYQAGLVLAVFWVFVAMSSPGERLAQALLRAGPRLAGLTPKGVQLALDPHSAQLLVAGIAPGFLLATVLTRSQAVWIGVIVILFILWYNWESPGASRQTLGSLLLLAAVGTLLYMVISMLLPRLVFAHDGGWQEAGGNFEGWWESEGRNQALTSGASPSAGSVVGVSLSDVLGQPQAEGEAPSF